MAIVDDVQVWKDSGEVMEPVEGVEEHIVVRISRCVKDNPQAALLPEAENSHMARYALERILAPEAAQALRDALPKLNMQAPDTARIKTEKLNTVSKTGPTFFTTVAAASSGWPSRVRTWSTHQSVPSDPK